MPPPADEQQELALLTVSVATEWHWKVDLQEFLRTAWSDSTVRIDEVAPFGAGHSGYTYSLSLESRRFAGTCVVRLSPPNMRIAGPADVGRQGAIMASLGHAGIPVPQVLAFDSRPIVGGRSFALMERVDGEGFEGLLAREGPSVVAQAAIQVLHQIRVIPIGATGLGSEPSVAPTEELGRWAGLVRRAPEWVGAEAFGLARELETERTTAAEPALVHGDYHYGNLLFRGRSVIAVVDWEISEIGDPLLDLGCLAVASLRRRYLPEPNPTGGLDIPLLTLVGMYGASSSTARWSVALSCFKYAAILGYNLGLHESGKRHDPVYAQLKGTIQGLLEDGQAILRDGLEGW